MAWITPKTDWTATTNSKGIYTGDYFNWESYNRVLGNTKELLDLCASLYGTVISDCSTMKLKTYSEFPYADEWNAIEQAISDIDTKSFNYGYAAEQKTYYENSPMPTSDEYNRIESAQLALYTAFTEQQQGLRMLRFTLGFEASSIQE